MTRVPEEKSNQVDGASVTSRTFTSSGTLIGDGHGKIEGSKYSNILASNSQAFLLTNSELNQQINRAKLMHRERSSEQVKRGGILLEQQLAVLDMQI